MRHFLRLQSVSEQANNNRRHRRRSNLYNTMGKQRPNLKRPGCSNRSAPICDDDCCKTALHNTKLDSADLLRGDKDGEPNNEDVIQELIVIGAGVHSHALVLRLLCPEPDFLSDKQRHIQAEYKERMRPPREVNQVSRYCIFLNCMG